MQENSKIDFKIGDLVTIKNKPKFWSSLCCINNPIEGYFIPSYPYTARITAIKVGMSQDLSAKIGDYGWDLSELIKKDLITNVNPPENEIIPIPEKLMTVWDNSLHKKERVVFAKIGNKFLAWQDYQKHYASIWNFTEEIQ